VNIQNSRFPVQYSLFLSLLFFENVSPFACGEEFSISQDGKTLTVMSGEKVVLKYNIATVPSPEEDKPYYARSGHIHPVFTPQGHAVTGDMCSDHVHQHAIWFAWTNTMYDGRKVDFWNSQAQQGRIEHAEVLEKEPSDGKRDFKIRLPSDTGNQASFRVRLKHIDLTGKEPQTVLSEIWDVSVRAHDDVYVIDLTSTQTCTTEKPLVIKQYHYGAMGLRSPMAWNAPEGNFLTSEGKSRENGNHTRPDWVDSFGPVDDDDAKRDDDKASVAGMTVMQHPSNFRYPQPVRLHPKLSYFCFAPMVQGDFAIEPGEQYVSRFRYVVHDGPLDKEQTEALWREFRAEEIVFRVGIAKDGTLTLDGAAVTKDELKQQVTKRLAAAKGEDEETADATVEIDAHYDTSYENVIQVIQLLSGTRLDPTNGGIRKFKFRTPKKE
jgi:hypothetical protein